jgi:DNA-binding response OmpR family regulator/nucleotide-binding universal stress UspA family protein
MIMTDADATSRSVLVVDDESNVRLTLRQALEDLGLTVDAVSEGTEALARLDENDYDLMLLDLRMPGLGGLETLERTRRQAPDLPVVIVTAHGTVQNAVQAMRRGAVDVLLKPIGLDALRDLVGRVFREPSTPPDATPYDEWVQLATWHLRYRRTDAARHCLQEAVTQDDTRPEAHTLLGLLEGTRGHHEAARRHLEAAVERDGDTATARLLLDRLEEDAQFPVDRPESLLSPPASASNEASTPGMRTVSARSRTADDVPHRVLAVLSESVADGLMAAHRASVRLGAASARAHANGELLLLTVVEVPRQLALSRAEETYQDRLQEVQWQLEALAEEVEGALPVRPTVVVAHQTAAVVENTIAERSVQHLVGRWPRANGKAPGPAEWTDVLDTVSCEATLLRPGPDAASGDGTDVTAFVTDSPHAPFVARRAREWAQESGVATLTLLTIQPNDGTARAQGLEHRGQRLLWDIADRAGLADEQYEGRVLVSKDVPAAAARCASTCDRICVGAGRSASWAELAVGSFPEHLATSTDAPIALVRGPHSPSRSFLGTLRQRLAG